MHDIVNGLWCLPVQIPDLSVVIRQIERTLPYGHNGTMAQCFGLKLRAG